MIDYHFIVQTGASKPKVGFSTQQTINAHSARYYHKRRRESKANKHVYVASWEGVPEANHPCPQCCCQKQSTTTATMYRYPANGGYDPFEAFGFPMDARTNELLAFKKAYVVWPLGTTNYESLRLIQQSTWKVVLAGLHNSCSANAFLASAATMHSQYTGSNIMVELGQEFRGRALSGLRMRLSDKARKDEIPACMQAIMCADLSARDFDSATIHSRYLASTRLESWSEGARHALLWMEIHRAVSTLTQPTIDLDKYPRSPGVCQLESRECTRPDLDEKALGELYDSYRKLQAYCEIAEELKSHKTVPSPTECLKISTSLLLLEGRLLQFALKQRKPLLAAAALATLYCLRVLTRDECVFGGSYHDNICAAATVIVQRMEDLLVRSSTDVYSPSDSRLHFWILHIGSFIEERIGGNYHRQRLSDILDWGKISDQRCSDILSGFLLLDDDAIDRRPGWLFPPLRCFAFAQEV